MQTALIDIEHDRRYDQAQQHCPYQRQQWPGARSIQSGDPGPDDEVTDRRTKRRD